MIHRNPLLAAAAATALCCILPACRMFVAPADVRLAELQRNVAALLGEAADDARVTRFSADAGPEEESLSRLRRSVEYWNGDAGGTARWSGVLQPDRPTLYRDVLDLIDGGEREIALESYPFGAIGADVLSLVVYRRSNGEAIGWDYTIASESPKPRRHRGFVGYDDLRWWEYPQFLLDVPVFTVIGLKEFAGELVKAPLSFFDVAIVGALSSNRVPLVSIPTLERGAAATLEDLENGLQALLWRFRVRSAHNPFDLLQDLLGAIPLVGHYFGPRSPRSDEDAPRPATHVAISNGIFHGSGRQQLAEPWRREIVELRPDADVFVASNRHGGFLDVVWSLANLSHGYAYDLAGDIAYRKGVGPGSSVEILGHSGGAQRSIVASRLLRIGDIDVSDTYGLAGPTLGPSAAERSTLLLNPSPTVDPVSDIGRSLPWVFFFMPNNVTIDLVRGAGPHRKPFFPNGATRAPEDGYAERLRAHMSR